MRQLSQSTLQSSHPQVQRALLQCLRLTERVRVESDAMERLEWLGVVFFFVLVVVVMVNGDSLF